MCGFVGFINKDSDTEIMNTVTVHQMADRILHRGPDQEGYYVDSDVSLGFRRLSIIDVDGGSQPLKNADGSKILVFNGEIYNYKELRDELEYKGYKFKTNTDSETILHGYEEWGKDVLERLRGMFAFVIWDSAERKLFGARDIFGIKPFFYYLNSDDTGEETFLFASEIKAFLANPYFKKELNEERVPDFLCFEYIPTKETLFKNVYKLEPGCYFEYTESGFVEERYYDIGFDIDETRNEDYWVDKIEKAVQESSEVHALTADVPVGCFLSSGVDSSYVVHEMNKHMDVKSFSVGFENSEYSELEQSKIFAGKEGVENISEEINAEEFFEKTPVIQYFMDEPLPNPSAVPLYFLTKLASKQVKVVLSGEGADELFGGYHYYHEPLDFEKYMKLPLGIRNVLGGAAEHLPNFHGRRFLMRGRLDMPDRYIRNNYVFNYSDVKNVLSDEFRTKVHPENPAFYTRPYFNECENEDDISKMQYVDIRTWLVQDILVKADRMSMANSLELRVPFLDKNVLDVAMHIPSKYRIAGGTTKYILRKAAERSLPQETAGMVKKGFITPLNNWLKEDKYYEIVRRAFVSETAQMFFNVNYILKLLNDHRAGHAANMKKIWMIYVFIIWYNQYFIEN